MSGPMNDTKHTNGFDDNRDVKYRAQNLRN